MREGNRPWRQIQPSLSVSSHPVAVLSIRFHSVTPSYQDQGAHLQSESLSICCEDRGCCRIGQTKKGTNMK
jgi:hypothetical protein